MDVLYPWQEALWRQVQQAIAAQRIPHALLFSGPQGAGKEAFARLLLKGLLCRRPQGGFPCGRCDACRLVEAGSHPDMMVLVPEGPGRPIRIDQVRALGAFVTLGSQALRIALMVPAEAMNVPAANSLLKILEEPPPDTLLLLVSHRPGRLLPTVRSRLERLHFPLPPRETALAWLAPRLKDAAAWLDLAGGSPLKALALSQRDVLARRKAFYRDLLRLHKGLEDPVACAERWKGEGVEDWILEALADMIRLKHGLSVPDEVRPLGEGWGLPDLHALWDRCMAIRRDQEAYPNLNPQMVLETLLITWRKHGDTPPRHAVARHQEQGGPL